MFAYCSNNPVNCADPSGMCPSCAAARNSDQIMTDVLCGFGGGSSLTLAGSAVAVGSVVQVVAQAQTLATTQEPKITYTVYFLCKIGDASKTIIYVGRVKSANFDARMNYHKTQGREYVASIDCLDYNTCRAIEQAGMVYFHTINRQDAIYNQIRGISPTNKNLYMYMSALWDYINSSTYTGNEFIPLSYFANLTEEAFLNGTL